MIGGYLFSARKFRNISRNDDGPEFRTKMKQNIEINWKHARAAIREQDRINY